MKHKRIIIALSLIAAIAALTSPIWGAAIDNATTPAQHWCGLSVLHRGRGVPGLAVRLSLDADIVYVTNGDGYARILYEGYDGGCEGGTALVTYNATQYAAYLIPDHDVILEVA